MVVHVARYSSKQSLFAQSRRYTSIMKRYTRPDRDRIRNVAWKNYQNATRCRLSYVADLRVSPRLHFHVFAHRIACAEIMLRDYNIIQADRQKQHARVQTFRLNKYWFSDSGKYLMIGAAPASHVNSERTRLANARTCEWRAKYRHRISLTFLGLIKRCTGYDRSVLPRRARHDVLRYESFV